VNVFFIPGSSANFDTTIRSSVDQRILARHMRPEDIQKIVERSKSPGAIHCWAFKKGRLNLFNKMTEGDRVLLKESGTGLLGYMADVCYKVHSITLGQDLWPDQAETPWEYIYFLKNVREMDIRFEEFKRRLHFKPNFAMQGSTK
jgi:hypothetical protein